MKTTIGILRPKLRPPRVGPNRLARQRLLVRLDQGLTGQFTLVAAPAGYGKTTLLAQWVGRQDRPSVWLTLDEGDNDPSLLLVELVAAVRTVFPDSCQSTGSLLGRAGLPPLELLTRELANELDELDEFILVLDDCQNLKNPHALEILRSLIYQPPQSLHLVLSSRADPMLPLGALRGRGLLNEVRVADLRFSYEEGVEYLGKAIGRPLTDAQLSFLLERTEGWIAGLHLAVLSLLGREDIDQGIREFAGSDRYIADYLMDELWAQLDPTIRSYLTATSILDRLSAPLCRAVLGEGAIDSFEGRPMLEWLEDSNLFVVSLDEHREWFRYHHLFRELLRRSLHGAFAPKDVAALHIRAAQWLGAHDQVDDALGHLLVAGSPELAADLVEAYRRIAIDGERWLALERWLGKLGPDIVDRRPSLVLIRAWLAQQRADIAEMLRHCERAEELLDLRDEPPGDDEALRGEIAGLRAQANYWQADGEKTLIYSRKALSSLPPDYRLARATATLFEAAGLHLLGQNQAAFEVFRRGSYGEYGRGLHPRAMIGLGLVALATGDVDYAYQVANLMLSQAIDVGLEESAGWAHYLLGMTAYLRNDLSGAEAHFGAIDPYASHAVPGRQSSYGLAWVRQAQGRPDEALEAMDLMASVVSDLNLPFGHEVRLLRARLAALSGLPVGEVALARSLLPWEGDGPLQLNMCHELSAISALAVLLMEGSDDDLAACQVAQRRLLASAETTGNTFRSVQCLILQALILDRQERNPEGLASLAQAVEVAKPGRLVRLFPEMGDRVYALLQSLRVRGGSDAFVDGLIASFAGDELQPGPASRPHPHASGNEYLIETLLTNREIDVLVLLEQRMSNKEIAKRLVISPATVKRHTLSIYSKLAVGNRREAAAKARHLGIIPASQ
jgi:LuxR family maltose regulon positive regulatory protein